MRKIIIAIDGPAGSGKTTTAKLLSEKLNYLYIDTGAMYRAITLAWINSKTEMRDESLTKIINDSRIELVHSPNGQITMLNGVDVSEDIRSQSVNKFVSAISANEKVRSHLVRMQRELAKDRQCVLDGRDIGSVVFPDAELKVFLVASIGARAKRRHLEYEKKGIADLSFDEIATQINQRDNFDSARKESPLTRTQDAIEIDTTNLTIEQQVDKIYDLAIKIINS